YIERKELPWQLVALLPHDMDIPLSPETEMYKELQVNFNSEEDIQHVVEYLGKDLIAVVNRNERMIPYYQKLTPFLPKRLLVPSVNALIKSTEKTAMRKAFWKYDKSITPKFEILTEISDEEIKRINKRLEFPVIVKPSGLAQAVLVQAAHYPAELKEI